MFAKHASKRSGKKKSVLNIKPLEKGIQFGTQSQFVPVITKRKRIKIIHDNPFVIIHGIAVSALPWRAIPRFRLRIIARGCKLKLRGVGQLMMLFQGFDHELMT